MVVSLVAMRLVVARERSRREAGPDVGVMAACAQRVMRVSARPAAARVSAEAPNVCAARR
jgi:hypothetical protein